MPWASAAIIGGTTLASGYLANEAADDARDASSSANALVRRDLSPYRNKGKKGLKKYWDEIKNYEAPQFEFNLEDDPIYQFQRDEGINAATRQMNAGGYGNSGNILNELQQRGTGIAGQYQDQAFGRQLNQFNTNYNTEQDWLNRLYGMAGVGQNSAAQTGSAGMTNAGNIADAEYYKAGSYNNALQGAASNYLTYDYLNKPYRGATTNSLNGVYDQNNWS